MGGVRGAKDDEILACEWLKSLGNDCEVLPKTYAKHQSERMQHTDHGDLKVVLRMFDGTIPRVMGVKGRSIEFTSREDFPFPTLIVCSVNSWKYSDPKPRGFISLCKCRKHAAIVWSSTRRAWKEEDFVDGRPNRGEKETNYVCPTHCVQFFDMMEERNE